MLQNASGDGGLLHTRCVGRQSKTCGMNATPHVIPEAKCAAGLALDKGQKVGVDYIGVRCEHAVRIALVQFENTSFD